MFSSVFLPQAAHPFAITHQPQQTLHPYQVYSIDDDDELSNDEDICYTTTTTTTASPLFCYPSAEDDLFSHHPPPHGPPKKETTDGGIPFYSHQALTAHNRRMIIPYKKQPRSPGSRNNNRVITSSSPTSTGLSSMRDEPLVMYRFFEFCCTTCEQSWLSPLYRAKDGLFCRICHQFCQPRGIRHSLTPYLGKETCYGKYSCHNCNRGFSSYKSLSNCPDQCFQCGTLVYPYYQIAHSVLYQKMRKNDPTSFKPSENAMTQQHHQSNCAQMNNSQNNNNNSTSNNTRLRQNRHYIRKIASGIITSSSSAKHQQSSNKKRLHCLNNVLQHNSHLASSQLGRRQVYLKACYSEPTIGNTNN